jgi:hypothetical protein
VLLLPLLPPELLLPLLPPELLLPLLPPELLLPLLPPELLLPLLPPELLEDGGVVDDVEGVEVLGLEEDGVPVFGVDCVGVLIALFGCEELGVIGVLVAVGLLVAVGVG